eukprot:gene13859-16343_t
MSEDNDFDKIFPGFYIGSLAAIKRDILDDNFITHVLSVMSGYKAKWPKMYTTKVIDVHDMATVDIKKYFDETFEFIEQGRQEGAVLVHCFAGMSRSASVCIAYLIRKLKISYDDAYGLVKDARSIVCPNPGFVRQLKEYEQSILAPKKTKKVMVQKTITTTTPADGATAESSSVVVASMDTLSIKDNTVEIEVEVDEDEHKYCCRKCSKVLFKTSGLVMHGKGGGQNSFKWARRAKVSEQIHDRVTGERHAANVDECTSYFLNDMLEFAIYNQEHADRLDGKLICDNPRCNEKLGSWSWSGAQCSCGAWVAPSFQVPKSRVDQKNNQPTVDKSIITPPNVRTAHPPIVSALVHQ